MTGNLCVKAICAFLSDVMESFRLQAWDKTYEHTVQVIEGALPAKHGALEENYPFCLVQPVSGSMGEEGTELKVDILFGAYSEEDQGYQYAMNMARRAAQAIWLLQGHVLDHRYMQDGDLEWEMEGQHPGWIVTLHTTWKFRAPVQPAADEIGAKQLSETVTLSKTE